MRAFVALPATHMFVAVVILFAAGLLAAGLIALSLRFVHGEPISRAWERLTKALDQLDLWLGRLAARLLDQPRPMERWARLIVITVAICVVGSYAPPAIAIMVLLAGLIWSYMIYRLWSSDENDRARGFSGVDKRIPLNHGIFHEVWFIGIGVVAIFVLMFFQFNTVDHGKAFDIPARYGRYSGYFAFVAAELQRLTPELRELDLIHGQFAKDIEPISWLGSGVTLVFRILGELLIISGSFESRVGYAA